MISQSRNSKILEKALLKSIVPYLTINSDWSKGFSELGRISTISYADKSVKQKKPKCFICGKIYQNLLLFIIHLQMVHKEDTKITKYQFCQQNLTIHSETINHLNYQDSKKFLSKSNNKEILLLNTLKERIKHFLNQILSKFIKIRHNERRQYFHSTDIFRQIRPESQDQDSQAQIGHIERDLQKMRIGDFWDVNQNDKNFFIKWNDAVHKAKKQNIIIDHQSIVKLLCQFAVKSKNQGIKRINLVMHGWTLWSAGKISADQVTKFLLSYDQTSISL